MKRWQFYTLAVVLVAALVLVPLLSQDSQSLAQNAAEPQAAADSAAAEPAPASLPDAVVDPAFEKYVDIALLLDAWRSLDAVLMTDVALQLAEGERVLMRSHKAGSSADLLKLAAKSAAAKNDKTTLDRIAKAAKASGNADITAQIAAAAKLAGASRADEPALKVSVDQTAPDDFALYSDILQGIKAAELVGDRETLKSIGVDVEKIKGLTDKQKEYLKKVSGAALTALPEKPEQGNSVADTLRKLEGDSRGITIGIPIGGGHGFYGISTYGRGGYYGSYGGQGYYGHNYYRGGHNYYGSNYYGSNYYGSNYRGHNYYGHNYYRGHTYSSYGHNYRRGYTYGHVSYGHSFY